MIAPSAALTASPGSKVPLTFACGLYDRVLRLYTGEIQPQGIDLKFIVNDEPREIFDRMAGELAYDLSELSASEYISRLGNNQCPFIALPVFASRVFRHGFIFLNAAKNIRKPSDLVGKKVGLRNFQATANLWIRGILEHEYQLLHRSIQWFKQDEEEVEWTPPSGLNIQRVAAGKNVEQMLVEGELDALIHPEVIQPILNKDQRVSRLFPAYRELEIEYFKRTGIFPIMHTTAIKQEVVEKYPWVPINLMQAFEDSKR